MPTPEHQLTTEGFGDVIEIGRQIRDPMYATRLLPTTPVFLLPGAPDMAASRASMSRAAFASARNRPVPIPAQPAMAAAAPRRP